MTTERLLEGLASGPVPEIDRSRKRDYLPEIANIQTESFPSFVESLFEIGTPHLALFRYGKDPKTGEMGYIKGSTRKGWQKYVPTVSEIINHVERGGNFGIVPVSVGFSVTYIDSGEETAKSERLDVHSKQRGREGLADGRLKRGRQSSRLRRREAGARIFRRVPWPVWREAKKLQRSLNPGFAPSSRNPGNCRCLHGPVQHPEGKRGNWPGAEEKRS